MNPILTQTAPDGNGNGDDLDNDTGLVDEPSNENSDSTDASDRGDNDHHQDDNYALGGHVTRSSE